MILKLRVKMAKYDIICITIMFDKNQATAFAEAREVHFSFKKQS